MKSGAREVFLDALVTGDAPGAIERQEKRGQTTFVKSLVLPIKCIGCSHEQLEELGITFGDPVDDLFIEAELPDGWEKRATDHSMWSELVDDEGHVRANIFYKAAFYDRRADISLTE